MSNERSWKAHKYIAKVPIGKGFRYFYTKAAYEAYEIGKRVAKLYLDSTKETIRLNDDFLDQHTPLSIKNNKKRIKNKAVSTKNQFELKTKQFRDLTEKKIDKLNSERINANKKNSETWRIVKKKSSEFDKQMKTTRSAIQTRSNNKIKEDNRKMAEQYRYMMYEIEKDTKRKRR